MHAENEKAQADLKNMDAELKPWVARYQADETDCLRDLDWPDIQIQSLNDEIIAENVKKEYRTRGPTERREPLNPEVSDD